METTILHRYNTTSCSISVYQIKFISDNKERFSTLTLRLLDKNHKLERKSQEKFIAHRRKRMEWKKISQYRFQIKTNKTIQINTISKNKKMQFQRKLWVMYHCKCVCTFVKFRYIFTVNQRQTHDFLTLSTVICVMGHFITDRIIRTEGCGKFCSPINGLLFQDHGKKLMVRN